jgi:hypothetical protein
MKQNTVYDEPRTITLAELCEAIGSGSVPARIEDDMYVIRNSDLMRLTHSFALRLPLAIRPARDIFRKAS